MRQEEFRRVCSRFATGVAILTVTDEAGAPHGLTVNSFTSVSAAPPLVLVCIDNNCSLLPLFERAACFGLCFLEESQQDLSSRFAFVPERRFDGVAWTPSPSGLTPVLDGVLGWMECRVERRIAAGDHVIVLGEVTAGEALGDGQPLLYFASGYRQLAG